MSAYDWMHIILLGAIIGAFAQAARVIVGLNKIVDTADVGLAISRGSLAFAALETKHLLVTLTLGACAGAIAAAMMITDGNIHNISRIALGGIAAAGYSGADFIEGVMLRAKPTSVLGETDGNPEDSSCKDDQISSMVR